MRRMSTNIFIFVVDLMLMIEGASQPPLKLE